MSTNGKNYVVEDNYETSKLFSNKSVFDLEMDELRKERSKYSDKTTIGTLMLCFLLGGFGIHRPLRLHTPLRGFYVAVHFAGPPKQSPGLFGLRPSNLFQKTKKVCARHTFFRLAEKERFELSNPVKGYTISTRARSTSYATSPLIFASSKAYLQRAWLLYHTKNHLSIQNFARIKKMLFFGFKRYFLVKTEYNDLDKRKKEKGNMLPKEPYKRFAVMTLYVAVGVAAVYIIFSFLWDAIFPFLLAYVFAECFRPLVRYSEENPSFPKKFAILGTVIFAAFALCFLLYLLGKQLVLEINDLSATIKDTITMIRTDDGFAAEIIEKINGMVPFFDLRDRLWHMRSNLDEELWGIATSVAETASGRIFSFLGSLIRFLPNALLSFGVVIIATYYFAVERVKVNCFFISLFPRKFHPTIKKAKDLLSSTVWKYIRAYGLLFLITFGELLTAFLVMGVEYSFVLALVISLIDVLPILGTGTVLIPWGVLALISGDYGRGIGILVTYAVITVVRQISEPKIVGKFIGISPLATLASMYIGLRLLGITGLFLFPIGAILFKKIYENKIASRD